MPGVDSEAIDASLAGLDASEAAYAAARPKAERLASRWRRKTRAAFKQKLGNFLLRRGFQLRCGTRSYKSTSARNARANCHRPQRRGMASDQKLSD